MRIVYKNKKFEKICTCADAAEKRYGTAMAEKLQMRLDEIRAADSVDTMVQFRIGRCHQLHGKRQEQFAVDLAQPFRLIFERTGEEGDAVKLLEIVDYH